MKSLNRIQKREVSKQEYRQLTSHDHLITLREGVKVADQLLREDILNAAKDTEWVKNVHNPTRTRTHAHKQGHPDTHTHAHPYTCTPARTS